MRAALYLRVSTADQHSENQLPELERFAAMRDWDVVAQYVDHGVSGAKASRPALDTLLASARRGELDAVLAWSASRFGRSLVNSVLAMHELVQLGVALVFVTQGVDTTTPIGRGVAALLAGLAEQEREEICRRTREGMARSRANGQRLGRPRAHQVDTEEVRRRREGGESWRMISAALGVPSATLRRGME
ncbi:MAG: recombinase family protein [Chloroflexota bacterium]